MPNALPPPGSAASTSTDVLIWVGVLIVAVLALGVVILVVRKRVFAGEQHRADNWIGDLRQMHKRGELSTEEYEAARRALTAKFTGAPAPAPPPPPPRPARTPAAKAGATELHARPGFDLTGEPLPKRAPPAPPTPPAPGPYDRKPPP